MSSGGGTTTQTTVDPRILNVLQGNYNRASSIANQPYQPYTGQLVATPSAATQQGQGLILNGAMNAGTGTTQQAINDATRAAAFKPVNVAAPNAAASMAQSVNADPASINRSDIQNVNAQTGLGDIQSYLNPYIDSVLNPALSDLDRQRQIAITGSHESQTADNTFGGDRTAIMDAETNKNYANTAAQLAGGLLSQGYDTAAGLLQNDQNRSLTAAQSNQAADLSTAGQNAGLIQQANLTNAGAANQASQFNAGAQNQASLANQQAKLQAGLANQSAAQSAANTQLQASGLLGNLGTQQLQNYLTGAGAVQQVGAQQDATSQANLDALYQQYLNAQQYPFQTQTLLNQSAGLIPAANGTMQTVNNGTGGNTGAVVGAVGTVAAAALAAF